MNDHNLDDLIINDIEPKNSKTKSFLTVIALLIVVLIVAIILTKIILKDPNAKQLTFEENNTEIISPELILQSTTVPKPKTQEIKKETSELSNIIENAFKSPVQEPKAPDDTEEEVAKETVELTKEVIKKPVVSEQQKEDEANKIREARLEQEEIAKAEKEKAEIAKVEKAAEEKVKKAVPSKIVEKAKVKPAGRPVSVPKKPRTTRSQTFYIQVGSFTKTPSKQFLGIIKNSGFNYKITAKAANGTKKLLIGPYRNRPSANSALIKVKDRINKNAFVIKK